jgi:hypothetical protein
MQTTHFWNKLNLSGNKVAFAILVCLIPFSSFSQGMYGLNSTSGSDAKFVSYGFFLAAHTNTYRIKYTEEFFNPLNTSSANVASIYTQFNPGFSLGFAGILRFHDQLHLLFTPKVGFYEYKTQVNYFNDAASNQTLPNSNQLVNNASTQITSEATMVELPLLMKYRSQRFNNTRMYFIGGGSYQFRTKSQEEANLDKLVTTGQDFTIEMGMGFEIYFRYFKFAPEIRFSHGLNNLYQAENSLPELRDAISSIKTKSITLYLNFQ